MKNKKFKSKIKKIGNWRNLAVKYKYKVLLDLLKAMVVVFIVVG